MESLDLAPTLVIALLIFASAILAERGLLPTRDPLFAWLSRVMAPTAPATAMLATGEAGGKRRMFRRRAEAGVTEDPEPVAEEPQGPGLVGGDDEQQQAAPDSAARTAGLDHIPFEIERSNAESDEAKLKFKDRFKRGLAKTRDVLNRDVTEALGAGPVSESFDEIEEILIRSDLGVDAAVKLSDDLRQMDGLNSDNVVGELKTHMRSLLESSDRRLRVNPGALSLWMVVGVNGAGKTTSIAKLARLARDAGFRVCLVAADTFRAAAVEQLQTWGDRVGVPVISQGTGADPGAVVFDAIEAAKARNYDLLIVDTAGRLQNRKPLMDELAKVKRIVERHPGIRTESLLVIDATTGQNGISQARGFTEVADLTGVILAKLDGTAKGGIVFAVERDLSVPVKAVGLGEGADDLSPFDPDDFVDALFEAQ